MTMVPSRSTALVLALSLFSCVEESGRGTNAPDAPSAVDPAAPNVPTLSARGHSERLRHPALGALLGKWETKAAMEGSTRYAYEFVDNDTVLTYPVFDGPVCLGTGPKRPLVERFRYVLADDSLVMYRQPQGAPSARLYRFHVDGDVLELERVNVGRRALTPSGRKELYHRVP